MKTSFTSPKKILSGATMVSAAAAIIFATDSAQAQRALGIDVSSYQGSGVNWSSVHGAGISYAWAKSTEGVNITDADFTINASHGKSAGVAMGAYHFAHPNANSPGPEASYFWGVAGGYVKADGKTFQPMLDFEVFSGHVGASSYSAWANAWCNAIVSDGAGAGVKLRPAIYTSACSACNFDSSISGWFASIANYNGESPQTGTPWSSCASCDVWGSGYWNSWQYTASGSVSGVSGSVDRDVLNGGSISGMIVQSTVAPTALRDDFNNDGRDDYVFFRPSDGTWHVTFSSDNSTHTFQFGQNGDIPLLCGDFDGDGAADAVLFRPSTHEWYVRFSSDASVHSFNFGTPTDIPLLGGDFDGDGQADATLFRPSTGEWFVRFSNNAGVHSFQFGQNGDIPLMNGDFDGDGSPDAVLFRPSTATWYVRFSSDGSEHSFSFGQSTDVPVLGGDFDGDGQPDAIVFRPSTGEWYVRFSSDASVHSFQFGTNGDIPFTSSITSDHVIDQNLYRPSTGVFYVRDSSTGTYTSKQLGTSTDIPVH
jgi:GH25 family lysozyme M1 (1,4-beta-N-acetylmuramidase)